VDGSHFDTLVKQLATWVLPLQLARCRIGRCACWDDQEEPAMESATFDRLTTTIATSGTRRAMLTLALGGLLAGIGRETALAKNKKNNKKKGCRKGQRDCNGTCIPKVNCCFRHDCERQRGCTNEECINGQCQCPPGLTMHNGVCGFFIECKGTGETCTSSNQCCGRCEIDRDSGLPGTCAFGTSLYQCIKDEDCASGPGCRGYLCPEALRPYLSLCQANLSS
jgi:hypothetical protein